MKSRKLIKGVNDLETLFPELIKNEWDFEKNIVNPNELTCGSRYYAYWRCKNGHSWQAHVYSRTSKGVGCRFCSKQTSIPEVCIYLCLNDIFNEVYHREKINGIEYDIYIKDLNLLIEYNGWYYHKNRIEKDNEKYCFAKNNGFNFITIVEFSNVEKSECEDYYNKLNRQDVFFINKNKCNCVDICKYSLEFIRKKGVDFDYSIPEDIEGRAVSYCKKIIYEKSIEYLYPEVSIEWDNKKNGNAKPSQFSKGSHFKAWWIGKCGHNWKSEIASRIKGVGCPICKGKQIVSGINDLVTFYPDILKVWDFENNKVSPYEIAPHYNGKVFLICEKGHSYPITLDKYYIGRRCPFCANQKVLSGYNDITTTCVELLKYWDFEKNTISPNTLTKGNDKIKVYWKKDGVSFYGTVFKARKKYHIE